MEEGENHANNWNVHFWSWRMPWRKSSVQEARGGEGNFATVVRKSPWTGSVNPGTWTLRQASAWSSRGRNRRDGEWGTQQLERRSDDQRREIRWDTVPLAVLFRCYYTHPREPELLVNRTISTARLRVMLLKMYTDYCSPAFLYYLVWVFFYLHTSSWGFTISRPHPKTPQILLQERLIHYRYTLIQIQRNSFMGSPNSDCM